jgi:cysteine desulfurase
MLVNNETGIIQDISLIASLVHKYGGIIHTDAVQALGKMPIDMPNLGVDLLTISAHKAGGPLGVGCLISNKRCQIESMIKGGSQEMNRRAGTENVPAIAAFAKLTDYIEEEISKHQQVAKMREKMEEQISAYPGAKIVGQDAPRISNTSCIMMHNVPSQLQLMHFDLNNIALSAGAACSSGKISASHVLTSMGYSEQEASSAIRVSLGTNNTEAELESFISLWQEIYYKHETGLRGQK